jgi:aminopeptidase N
VEVLMQPGVSAELARHRAQVISDVEYRLELDLRDADHAPGTLMLVFDYAAGESDLVVDFRGSALDRVSANGRPVTDYEWRNGHIRIPARHLRAGRNELSFRFTAPISASGSSIIRFDDPSDGSRYLYTLLVPADANQLFPSFDQPDLKAAFRFELVTPAEWRVVANGPMVGQVAEGDAIRSTFAAEERFSTYLAAFAAGPWTSWTSAPPGGRPITLYARRSLQHEVDSDTLIRINRDALEWLERRFASPYPFVKLDLLLAPAFPFGGMEHVGAIFYNESRFVFREPPTLSEQLGRKATIYHEVAHQWFGDLVTMRWFDDLWLKEGFSTYTAARMQDELDPGTGAWKTFYLRNKPLAYATDATSGTTPVWQALANLDLAKSNYGPIVYNKAPSILKQLSFLVGEDAFWAGVSIYLQRHAYGNATWQDLLAALEEASGTSLRGWGEHYILRAGVPVIETAVEADGNQIGELRLIQRPARELPGDRGGSWPGKVRVRLGYRDRPDVLLPVTLTGDTTRVAEAAGLPLPDYVFANDGDYGYGIFLLDPQSTAYLAERVGSIEDELFRAMVWGALWDGVREARVPAEQWIETALRELPREPDEQIAAFVLGRTSIALGRYLRPNDLAGEASPANAEGVEALQRRWEQLLLSRAQDSALSYGMRKASLDALIAGARGPQALQALKQYLAGDVLFDGAPLRQPSRWSIIQTLLAVQDPSSHALFAAEQARDTTPDAQRQAFIAGAAIPTAENKAEYFRRYLQDAELNEEWVTASLGAFNHPRHTELTLPFLNPALERLPWIRENRRIFFLPQWVNAFIGGQRSTEALAAVDTFLANHPNLAADLRLKTLQARDELERTVRIRSGAATSAGPN